MTRSLLTRLLAFLYLAILLFGASSANGDERPALALEQVTLRETVERHISQLDAVRRSDRLQAQRELLDLGPIILPHLPPPELVSSEGSRLTLARIRVALERRKALESVQPSRVSLSGSNSLKDILTAISKQTGNTIVDEQLSTESLEKKLDVAFENAPFWPALDALAKRGGFRLSFDGTLGIQLQPMNPKAPQNSRGVAYADAFRIELQKASVRIKAGTQKDRLLRLSVGVASEPRLRPLFLNYTTMDITCSVGDGPPLSALSPAAQYDHPLGEGGRFVGLTFDFNLPADANLQQPLKLGGKLTMQTAAGSERIRFTNLSRSTGVARRRGGVTVTLEKIRSRNVDERGRDLSVRALVVYDVGGPAFESHRTWIFHNEVFLESEDGENISPDGYDTSLQQDGAVAVDYRFSKVPARLAEWSFVYVAPTLLLDVPIDFELPPAVISKDLKPLPASP